jgi:TrmH family RNA methyltransferase
MVPKQIAKFAKSLQNKKFRREYHQFLVEGEKSVLETIHSKHGIQYLIATEFFVSQYKTLLEKKNISHYLASDTEIQSLSSFQSNTVLAICDMNEEELPLPHQLSQWTLVLDDINDPGNLGTIIRIADWYGIKNIVCSLQTVELYNPKVIAASKGSFLRVSVFYTQLETYLQQVTLPLYAADLMGEKHHTYAFPEAGILVMGSEASGIRPEIEQLIDTKITIPKLGAAESLNVAMATAILCDRIFYH